MNSTGRLFHIFTLLSLLFFSNQDLTAQAQTKPQLKNPGDESAYTLPAGTVIRVRMDNGITSRSASAGDTFTVTVFAPVVYRGVEMIPAGAVIEGRVLDVAPAKRGGANGYLSVAFETLRLRGVTRRISGDLGSPDEEVPAASSSGDAANPSVNRRGSARAVNVGFIAGGAGAGALVGGLTKGGGGAAIGGALGAGAGALVSYFRKGDDAVIGTDTQIGVVLKQNVTLPAQDY